MNAASTSASITVNSGKEEFFYWFMSVDPPKFLRRYFLIPGVVGVRNQSGPMYIPGSTREFMLSDGTSFLEEVLASDPPNSIHYRIADLTNMFRHLVKEGNASFTFTELSSGGTQVDWQYAFTDRNLMAALMLKALIPTLWRGHMRTALASVKLLAEKELARTDS